MLLKYLVNTQYGLTISFILLNLDVCYAYNVLIYFPFIYLNDINIFEDKMQYNLKLKYNISYNFNRQQFFNNLLILNYNLFKVNNSTVYCILNINKINCLPIDLYL